MWFVVRSLSYWKIIILNYNEQLLSVGFTSDRQIELHPLSPTSHPTNLIGARSIHTNSKPFQEKYLKIITSHSRLQASSVLWHNTVRELWSRHYARRQGYEQTVRSLLKAPIAETTQFCWRYITESISSCDRRWGELLWFVWEGYGIENKAYSNWTEWARCYQLPEENVPCKINIHSWIIGKVETSI